MGPGPMGPMMGQGPMGPGQGGPGQMGPGQGGPGQMGGPGQWNGQQGPGGGPWGQRPMGPREDMVPGLARGIPMSQRGHIALDAAGFTDDSGQDSLLAIAADVHIPVAQRAFIDARLPMAGYLPGNIMLGASRTSKLDARGFISYGAQLGLPLVQQRALYAFSLPNGTWNMHEYTAHFMPIKLGFEYERMLGRYLELRIDLEPILSIPIGNYGNNVAFTFQHAAELQVGHSVGGGLRVQGVAVTEDILRDAYQFSIEPFFVVRRNLGFARIGLMLPIDDSVAGPAFEQAWGLRLGAGLHID
ncbi:MAG: hypothetical protein R3B70_33355 [Polyangiaceae bacterium]